MSTLDRLAALPELAGIPREQLQWLLDHGEIRLAEAGATFRSTGSSPPGLFVLIEGRFSVRASQNGVEREVREVTPGRPTGNLPFSRMTTGRGYLVADRPVEYLWLAPEHLREMARACYEFTALCVHEMLERVRVFKGQDKEQEKMAALGRLAAGLAHELNNPASAAARAAQELEAARAEVVAAARALGACRLEGESLRALQSLEEAALRTTGAAQAPGNRGDIEERLERWLTSRGIDADPACNLAERGITVPDLDAAAAALEPDELARVVRCIAADIGLRRLARDIESAAGRIHALVAAVKRHTHMDRAPVFEPVPLEEHLADTVTLMRSKASLKGVSLALHVEEGLPPVEAAVADLNQVWLHLIDNAIDAGSGSGHVTIDARRENGRVVVRVIDDGPGIPAEDQERVFEPFFTTKDVGQGQGLGLDIVRTVVGNHRGAVDLTSTPGRTEFRVVLPVWGDAAQK